MAYSTANDLLIGDLMISPAVNKDSFVNEAADEIDSKLGYLYLLPLEPVDNADGTEPDPDDWNSLPTYQKLLLKQINNKLASGRIIMTLAMAEEGTSLHAYALRMVTEALNDLLLLANGDVLLAAEQVALGSSHPDRRPKVTNHDEESALEMFESVGMRYGEVATWQPGKARKATGADRPLYYGVVEG